TTSFWVEDVVDLEQPVAAAVMEESLLVETVAADIEATTEAIDVDPREVETKEELGNMAESLEVPAVKFETAIAPIELEDVVDISHPAAVEVQEAFSVEVVSERKTELLEDGESFDVADFVETEETNAEVQDPQSTITVDGALISESAADLLVNSEPFDVDDFVSTEANTNIQETEAVILEVQDCAVEPTRAIVAESEPFDLEDVVADVYGKVEVEAAAEVENDDDAFDFDDYGGGDEEEEEEDIAVLDAIASTESKPAVEATETTDDVVSTAIDAEEKPDFKLDEFLSDAFDMDLDAAFSLKSPIEPKADLHEFPQQREGKE
ncbi:UNVERIFIED_CONTAM: hypothetical protein HDU68_003283, partial [Siphonaria sp. JEL0065]